MIYTHILITRPEPEAGQLAEQLVNSPLVPVLMPAYAFTALAPGRELREFNASGGRKLVVFTSKRAVEFGLAQLDEGLLESATIAAIGPATAALLESRGVRVSVVPAGGFTSEHLLEARELSEHPGAALLVAAPGGRTALQHGLAACGWTVYMTHVYRRLDLEPEPGAVNSLLSARSVISAWTSENAMKSLSDRLPEPAWQVICEGTAVVTSERLARAIRKLGVKHHVIARGPGNDAILDCVRQLT